MEFEFDPAKSEANRTRHGIDFVKAQELWKDLYAVQIEAKSDTEPRFALIARLDGRVWSVFFTERSSKIRIISARRSRTNEENLYHEGRAT
jgi:uncharacterized DUF497 family protein